MGPGFPDRPERLRAIASALAQPRFAELARAEAPRASQEAILRVHTAAHLEKLEAATPKDGFTNLGADVAMNGRRSRLRFMRQAARLSQLTRSCADKRKTLSSRCARPDITPQLMRPWASVSSTTPQ